jgi:hypothetical protein
MKNKKYRRYYLLYYEMLDQSRQKLAKYIEMSNERPLSTG